MMHINYVKLNKSVIMNLDRVKISDEFLYAVFIYLMFCIVKAIVCPVVMYRCDTWAINKAERQRTDASELWCWKRLLRAPWTARRTNQSILEEINPHYSLEGLMLKLKL